MDDRCIAKFFTYHKEIKKKTHIKGLVRDEVFLCTQEEISDYV